MQTRSGFRSSTQSTASRTARRPREGTPRWRSERCAIRSPSSSAGTPKNRDVDHPTAQPACLEPRPGRDGRGHGGEQEQEPDQTESFSVTGATETTWRLNFSSELSSPAATPTSCERCKIGIWKSFPVCL